MIMISRIYQVITIFNKAHIFSPYSRGQRDGETDPAVQLQVQSVLVARQARLAVLRGDLEPPNQTGRGHRRYQIQ